MSETLTLPTRQNEFDGLVVVCPIDFEGLLDPRLLKEVGDLNTTNLSKLLGQTTSDLIALFNLKSKI